MGAGCVEVREGERGRLGGEVKKVGYAPVTALSAKCQSSL